MSSSKQGSGPKAVQSGGDSGSTEQLDAARESFNEAYAQLQQARKHFQLAAREAGVDTAETLLDKAEDGLGELERVGGELATSVRESPLKSLGIAVALGVLFATLVGRK